MVNLIDTHSHIYAKAFDTDRDAMLDHAQKQGVQRIYMPNIDLESIPGMLSLADAYPEFCIPMMGLHPCDVDENWKEVLDEMETWFDRRVFAAVGETGIDLYWDKTKLSWQQQALDIQVQWCLARNLPLVLHTRSATEQVLEVLRPYKGKGLRGVFHCFSEAFEHTAEILDMGFLVGIGGVLTYKNSGLPAALADVPLSRIVLETDAPYLAPVPYRGKRNEPAHVWHVAKLLAEIKGIGLAELAETTTANALELFSPS